MKYVFTVLAVVVMSLVASICHANLIAYDSDVLAVSYGGGWGVYFANRFTNEESLPVTIDEVLIRRTPFGGAADVYLWEDDAGSPGDMLGGPTFEWLDDTWQVVDVSSLGLSLAVGESIFAGFDPRSTAQIPYDNQLPGVSRSWWDAVSRCRGGYCGLS